MEEKVKIYLFNTLNEIENEVFYMKNVVYFERININKHLNNAIYHRPITICYPSTIQLHVPGAHKQESSLLENGSAASYT